MFGVSRNWEEYPAKKNFKLESRWSEKREMVLTFQLYPCILINFYITTIFVSTLSYDSHIFQKIISLYHFSL